ncbi:uncharacterized protein CLUP02_13397 [Colletotrichum lupini]|uniref:Uncharacterized protein n=1 Tax=Colletotrichum lupini TaxID=145971 RepID=A0A9Q8WLP0_9PEZI|nr:uncharacterized protein CLUP02_13397 [Colletotrichum lupini]UQC87876.1 hypothetical protein CLUP02_13397 [Colletotrichum lupini]
MATHFSLICGKSASQIHHPASRPSSTRRGSLSRELVISQHGSLSTNRDKLSAMFRLRLNCFPDDLSYLTLESSCFSSASLTDLLGYLTNPKLDALAKDIFIALVALQTRKRREQEGLKPERRMDWSRPLLCTSHILSLFIHFTSPRLARLWPN